MVWLDSKSITSQPLPLRHGDSSEEEEKECMKIVPRKTNLKPKILKLCSRVILFVTQFLLLPQSSKLRMNLYIRGVFNKLPDIFVQAFKIVVDSWKFSMLLLYILWDYWPIFMISASNVQLHQVLEYTLLKPDCHSWWISKMQSGRGDT